MPKPAERGRRRAARTGAAAAKVSYAAAQEDLWFCSAVKVTQEAVQAALNAAASEGMQAAAREAVQEAVQAAILLHTASEGMQAAAREAVKEAVQAAILLHAASEGMQAAAREAVQEAVQAAILLKAASEGNTDLLTALATAGTDVPVHAKDDQGYGQPLHRGRSTLHLRRMVRCEHMLAAQEDGATPCVREGSCGAG